MEDSMKIALTSTGNNLDSEVDPRFGRASFIIIVDTETLEFTALDNHENKNAFKGAGIKAASMINDNNAEALLTGYCGPNAFSTLDAAGIKVVNGISGTIKEAIEKFRQGDFEYADKENAEANWT